ncbi:MAG: transporter, partial [Sphingomonadales bacterium]|nr:transporter [Sphingomonadales bacterium]
MSGRQSDALIGDRCSKTDSAPDGVLPSAETRRGDVGAWFALWVLVLVSLFSFVDLRVLSLLTIDVATSLHLRDTEIGIVLGLGSAVFALLATYPLGWMTDRLDRRIVLSGCILVWSAGTAACGFASGFWTLFAAVLAMMAAEAGLPAVAYSAIPDLFAGRSRVSANQVFYVAMILSSAVGIAAGGAADFVLKRLKSSLPHFLDGFETWRVVFMLVAAPAPLLVLLVIFSRIGARQERPARREIESPEPVSYQYLRDHGTAVALVITALGLYGLPFLAVLTWTPAAFVRLFGLTPFQNGIGLSLALGLGCLVGVGLAAWLMKLLMPKLGRRAPMRISAVALGASIPSCLLFVFVQSSTQGFFIVGLLMATGTLIGSLLPEILQSLAPPFLRGRMVAVYGIVSVITGGLGVSFVGPIADHLPG